jgi:hypothetical protein|tara:strand:+ start:1203 stop:1676 length:474 start_codon:yes stop_codon:yes gene_type:complete
MKNELLLLTTKLNNYSMQLLAIVSSFFMPISGILILIGLSVILDTITGVWKARKLKTPVTSRKLSAIISKILLYEVTVMLFYLIDYFILNDIVLTFFSVELMTTKILALVLVSIEIISINENFKAVKGIDLWASLKNLFARAKEVTQDFKDINAKDK